MVERALDRFGDKFSLIHLMPSWDHRGADSFNCGKIIVKFVFFLLLVTGNLQLMSTFPDISVCHLAKATSL